MAGSIFNMMGTMMQVTFNAYVESIWGPWTVESLEVTP